MKKLLVILAAVAVIASAAFAGYQAGKNHVIYTQIPWVLDFDAPDPYHDLTVYIEIDGAWHEYAGYIG